MDQVAADVTPSPEMGPSTETPTPGVEGESPAPVVSEKPKTNLKSIIILVVLFAILIGVCLWRFVFTGDDEEEPLPVDNTNEVEQPVTVAKATKFGDYEFVLPEGYEVEEHDGFTWILNYTNLTALRYEVFDNVPYALFVKEKETYASYLGVNAEDITAEKVSDQDFLLYNFDTEDGGKGVIALTSFMGKHSVMLLLYVYDDSNIVERLADFVPMLGTANYLGTANLDANEEKTELPTITVDKNVMKKETLEKK